MSTPDARTPHPAEPAAGAPVPGADEPDGRTPHPEDPAEGVDAIARGEEDDGETNEEIIRPSTTRAHSRRA